MLGASDPKNLERVLANAQLPALPQSAIRLLELAKDSNNGPAEFAVPIEIDPGLTGQVLKFVNSSYFGFAREISSVKLAITMVGIRTIKNFSLWSAVFSLMPNPKCGPFELKVLWQDSLRRALFARSMGKRLGMREAEDLFAAALLQDMAVPLLAKEMPKEYEALFLARAENHARLSRLESERFGWNHAQAAARLAHRWNLPKEFCLLVERHAAIDEMAAETSTPRDQWVVALSSLLPTGSDANWIECQAFDAHFERLDAAPGAAVEILAQVDREFGDFAPMFKIATPARSLVESHQLALSSACT